MSKELETRHRNTDILLGVTGILAALGLLGFAYLAAGVNIMTDGKLDLHFGAK